MENIKGIGDMNRKRALFSYECIKDFMEDDDKIQNAKDLKSYSRKIPMLILNNGLLNTMVFLSGKAKDNEIAYLHLYKAIEKWCKDNMKIVGETQDIEEYLLSCSKSEYQRITKEIIEITGWFKRTAEALIEDK